MKKLNNGKKRLFSLGLALVMTAGMLLPANVQADEATRIDVDGVETSKTVIYDEETKEYTLRLESYVTGAKTEVSVEKAVPTDFVLAIDVSGSMHQAIECGCDDSTRVHNKSNHPVYADAVITDGQYYLDTNRTPLYYCADCGNWYDVEHTDIHEGTVYVPKTSAEDTDETHKQFYLSCKCRLEAAKIALDEFLNSVKANSKGKDGVAGTKDDVAHRVAIIAFGGPNDDEEGSQVTGLYTYGSGEHKVIYYNLGTNHYKDSLRDVTNANDWNILTGVSEKLAIQEGTRTDYATEMINNVLKNNVVEGRNRVAVLFTDGVPRSGNTNYKCANDALKYAVEFKNGSYATPFYVVGCFDGANASKIVPWDTGNNANKFMNLASSNFLNAIESKDQAYTVEDVNPELLTEEGEINPNAANYYQTVENTDEILNAFKTIFESSVSGGADASLDANAVVRDTISAEYVVDGDREAVAYVKAYTGKDTDGNDTWGEADYSLNLVPEVNGQVVDVTGFDFAANYVGFDKDLAGVETARGKKVVVEIPINPAADNKGGNFQAANEMSESGIYYPDSTGELIIVEQFDLPHVDIPTTVTVKKIVDEETPDIEQEFAFSATGESVVFKAYEGNDQTSGNHLEATARDMAVGFVMGHGDEFVIENLLVGSTITVNEENIPKYYGLVSVLVNGEELQPDQNGDYTFEVTADTEVVFTNKIVEIDLSGNKTWNDEDDKYGVRPESITINLLADGEKVDSVEVTAEDDWAWSFNEVPKYNEDGTEIAYAVTEEAVAGYTTETSGMDVTNTLERIEVTGSKTWDDEDDKYGVRPESITINLLADGEKVDSVEVTAEDDWTWTFDNLPKYNSDKKEVVYTVTEKSVAGYITELNGLDVTNTLERTEVTGSKTWDDEDDKYGVRPENITINLLADGEKVDSVEVTAEDDWAWTFDNLPKYNSDEKEVVYTITEDAVDGYTTRIEGYNVTNTHVPKVVVIPDTNDHSTTEMYILMMCMAVVAMTGIVAYRRKR